MSRRTETVIVLQDFRVPLYRSLPVLIDAVLQGCLGCSDLARMRCRVVELVGMMGYPIYVGRVSLFAPVGQYAEVIEDVVLCVTSDPCTMRHSMLVHVSPKQFFFFLLSTVKGWLVQ